MAKVQTRRTVSLSGSVYNAAKLAAEARGTSLSQFVTDLIRDAGVVPVTVHVPIEQARAAVTVKQNTRADLDARRIADFDRKHREYQEQAERNPCRRERCGILGLHPAHDEDAA